MTGEIKRAKRCKECKELKEIAGNFYMLKGGRVVDARCIPCRAKLNRCDEKRHARQREYRRAQRATPEGLAHLHALDKASRERKRGAGARQLAAVRDDHTPLAAEGTVAE